MRCRAFQHASQWESLFVPTWRFTNNLPLSSRIRCSSAHNYAIVLLPTLSNCCWDIVTERNIPVALMSCSRVLLWQVCSKGVSSEVSLPMFSTGSWRYLGWTERVRLLNKTSIQSLHPFFLQTLYMLLFLCPGGGSSLLRIGS